MKILAHLIKRPDRDCWYVQWKYEGESAWRRKSTGERAKSRANDFLRDFVTEREAMGPAASGRAEATLRHVVDDFLDYIGRRSSASWREACGQYTDTFVERIGSKRLFRAIGARDIEGHLAARMELVKKTTVRKEFYALKQLFKYAVSPGGFIVSSPMADMQPPRADDGISHDRVLTPAEVGRLLEAALQSVGRAKGDLLAEWIAVTYLTFTRKGEALRITWDDVDFNTDTVRIINDPAGRQHTKTAAERLVPMVPLLRSVLRSLPRHVSTPHLFFRKGTGRPWRATRNSFAGAVERADLNPTQRVGESDAQFKQRYERDKVTPHTLRHSGLTLLAEHGTDRWDIMRWAGHKTTQASERYIHLAGTRKRQIERVPIDEITFVESEIFDAHVYHRVYRGGEHQEEADG